jgi:PAS domain S-box-containing protein
MTTDAHMLALIARAADLTAEGISVADALSPDFPLIFVNAGFTRITGYSFEESVGRNCRFLQGKDTDRKEVDALRAKILKPEIGVFELLNYRKDGTKFWNRISMVPLFDENGQLTHFVGIQSDITALRESNQQLKELNAEKNRFLGMAAHDIRNPLTTNTYYCDKLIEGTVDPELKKIVEKIQKANSQILGLVNEYLDISKIESGTLSIALERKCLAEVLSGFLEPEVLKAKSKGIEVNIELAADTAEVNMDRDKFLQVLSNLFGNAVKFSRPNSVISVSLVKKADWVEILIADQGPGIPEEELKQLFQPFKTGSAKGTAGEKSTGLGLNIVRKIMDAHGGKIRVESTLKQGSTFIVSFPIA